MNSQVKRAACTTCCNVERGAIHDRVLVETSEPWGEWVWRCRNCNAEVPCRRRALTPEQRAQRERNEKLIAELLGEKS